MTREDDMLTTSEAAHVLAVAENTLRKWCNKGTVPHFRLPGRGDRRFYRSELESLIAKTRCIGR